MMILYVKVLITDFNISQFIQSDKVSGLIADSLYISIHEERATFTSHTQDNLMSNKSVTLFCDSRQMDVTVESK